MADMSQPETVILHQFHPYRGVPNPSPACLKLETYLRITKIPYKIDPKIRMSSKGKMPWIEYAGKEIADSNFIIKFLNEEFNVDLNKHLTATEKAVSLGLQRMVEENTYWTLVFSRWIENFENTRRDIKVTSWSFLDMLILKGGQSKVRAGLDGQGIGRHSKDEIYEIAKDDLRALSDYLGEKDFMMGSEPSLLDATVFGLIANCLWAETESCHASYIKENFRNLEQHSLRIKREFWPDWDKIIKREEKN